MLNGRLFHVKLKRNAVFLAFSGHFLCFVAGFVLPLLECGLILSCVCVSYRYVRESVRATETWVWGSWVAMSYLRTDISGLGVPIIH